MDSKKLQFYGTSTMLFDPEEDEAIIMICAEGSRNLLKISFALIELSLGARVEPRLLTDPFFFDQTDVEVHEIDSSSNDLLVRALGNEAEAKKEVASFLANNLFTVAHEVIACRVDSNQLPTTAQ